MDLDDKALRGCFFIGVALYAVILFSIAAAFIVAAWKLITWMVSL